MRLLLILVLTMMSAVVRASGCDWYEEPSRERTLITEFKAAGTIRCAIDGPCEVILDNYTRTDLAVRLLSVNTAMNFPEKRIKELNVKVVKIVEHGSCYNNGVIMSLELEYNNEVFRNDFSVIYP